MIRGLALAIGLISGPVSAEVAVVRGGEHPDFTRIVIQGRNFGDWRFGRSAEGYELQLSSAVTGFDLARAFDRIPKDRVSGLWLDQETGRLQMALSCLCHAVAFEFRPDFVVLDIKSGLPDPTSRFEMPLDPQPVVPVATVPQDAPAASTAPHAEPTPMSDPAASTDEMPLQDAQVPNLAQTERIGPLRDVLLQQISKGVADGVIDLAETPPLPDHMRDDPQIPAGARVSLGEMPGIAVGGSDRPLTAGGISCPVNIPMDLVTWLPPAAWDQGIAPSRAGLLGEFDLPQQDAITAAARMHLALGFGAEARQILDLVATQTDEIRILRSLAALIDLEKQDHSAFHGMQSCDSAAALWATLDLALNERLEAGSGGNTAAVTSAFSGLPVHLRRHLGPVLVDGFMGLGDKETASRLRDAILRAAGDAGPKVAIMEVGYLLSTGTPLEALAVADEVLKDPRSLGTEAIIALTEAAFAGNRVVAAGLPDQIAALLQEESHGAHKEKLLRAHVLAAAMAGDFDRAFLASAAAPDSLGDLWDIAGLRASDDVFLREGLGTAPQAASKWAISLKTGQDIAERFLGFGFPDQAKAWLGPVAADAPEERRLLVARAELELRDARGALRHLVGLTSSEADALRAKAVLQLGDATNAVSAYRRAGDEDGAWHALIASGDWGAVALSDTERWREAASYATDVNAVPVVTPPPETPADPIANPAFSVTDDGPIRRGALLADESAAVRLAVDTLLGGTP